MAGAWTERRENHDAGARIRVASLAARQAGRISRAQLSLIGVDRDRVARWRASGFLIEELPRVYAVGNAARSVEANLTVALLHAGPGAMLDGATAGWWLGAVRDQPTRTTVSTPRRPRSIAAPWGERIVVRGRRPAERLWLPRGGKVYGAARRTALRLPVTLPDQLALDLAATLSQRELRHALANLEYRGLLDLATLEGRQRTGSAALRVALAGHDPRFARTNSPWEDELLLICERNGIPPPDKTDTHIGGVEVDAVWHRAKLIVEIDGRDNHRSWAQIVRDRRNELDLRARGYLILRYTREQLTLEPARVAADIAAALSRPGRSGESASR